MRFLRPALSIRLFGVAALVCAGATAASAQTSYGTIAGSVTDPAGAAVAGAEVTVTNVDTKETHTVKTTSNGGYIVESVGTGLWNVTVVAPTFSKQVVEKVQVDPSTITSVNAKLAIGAAQDTIEVSSATEIIKTESGDVSETIGTKEISDLPVSSLNAYALATTLPGVNTVTVAGFTNGTAFTAVGTRPRENNFLIEGQDNNDAGIAGQGLQPENQEALQSVTFLLSGNPAEFGRGGGVISNLVYKSGTNSFHGAVWDRFLNADLNTYNHSSTYNGSGKTNFRENIYGYRFGGPIVRDKLFFFVSQQFDHYRASAVLSTLTVPTTAGYATLNALKSNAQVAKLITAYGGLVGSDPAGAGTPSAGKFPSNSKLVALGPDPVTGIDRGTVQFGGIARVIGAPTNSNEFVTKVDYQFTAKDKLQARFVRSPFIAPTDTGNFPGQLPGFDTNQSGVSYNAGLVENHIFSSSIFNELRLSYGRIGFTFGEQPATLANPLAQGPTTSISSITGFGIPTNIPQGRFHNTYQLQDALSVSKGSHSMKFGFDVSQTRVRDAVPFVFFGSQSYIGSNSSGLTPAYTALGNYVDDLSGNLGANTTSLTKNFGSNIARPTLTDQGYYGQDHWKVTPRLTADLGVRYEYYGAPFNYIAYPAIDPANLACFPTTSTVSCRVPAKPNYHNFAPRIGGAFVPFGNEKTVVRASFGMFYDNVFTNVADNIQASAPNAASPVQYNSTAARGTPSWSTQFAALPTTPLPTNSVTSMVPNLRNPIEYQYNLAVEQALPYSMSLTAAYIGTRGEHLYGLDYLNPTIPGTSTRAVATTRGPISVHDNSGDSNFNGGTLELQRKYRSGSQVRISYTYGKFLDNVSEEYTSGNYSAYPQAEAALGGRRGSDYGPSAFDHKQRAVLSYVYSIPNAHFGSGMAGKAAEYAVNGFQLSSIVSFQTGSVINVQDGLDINGDGVTNDRPVLINKSAPINTFAVLSTDYYSAAAGAAPGVYCDGTYLANALTKNPVTGANDNYCHQVSLSSVHFFAGNRYTQNFTINRNADYTPGTFSGDMALQRAFKIRESMDFQFRGECYNCLNHANTGVPNATLYSSGNQPSAPGYSLNTFYNYAPTTSGARTIRIFLKYEF
jgi:hypothetical protein